MAKSETHAIHVWQAVENLVCQRAGRRENDFAISTNNDDDPGNFAELCPSEVKHCAQPSASCESIV
jgi:hypothetical protein